MEIGRNRSFSPENNETDDNEEDSIEE